MNRSKRRARRQARETKYLLVTDIQRNPSFSGAVLLTTEPCPQCGKVHYHGNPKVDTDNDGTYGHRTAHCEDRDAEGYMLVPDRNPLTIEGLEE